LEIRKEIKKKIRKNTLGNKESYFFKIKKETKNKK
jgi:hypothetical protein